MYSLQLIVVASLCSSCLAASYTSAPTNSFSSQPGYGGGSVAAAGMPYRFEWGVNDGYSGNQYSHRQHSNGQLTEGEYRIRLPDSRLQIVSFRSNGKGGFVADVKYDGKAQFPRPTNQPSYARPNTAPQYLPPPSNHLSASPEPVFEQVSSPGYPPQQVVPEQTYEVQQPVFHTDYQQPQSYYETQGEYETQVNDPHLVLEPQPLIPEADIPQHLPVSPSVQPPPQPIASNVYPPPPSPTYPPQQHNSSPRYPAPTPLHPTQEPYSIQPTALPPPVQPPQPDYLPPQNVASPSPLPHYSTPAPEYLPPGQQPVFPSSSPLPELDYSRSSQGIFSPSANFPNFFNRAVRQSTGFLPLSSRSAPEYPSKARKFFV